MNIKLEVGEYYKRRDGKIVGPLESNTHKATSTLYPFTDLMYIVSYLSDGRHSLYSETPCDLVDYYPSREDELSTLKARVAELEHLLEEKG